MTIFSDNFSDNSKNWLEKDTDEVSLQVENGGYIIEHRQDSGWWGTWRSFNNHTQNDLGIKIKIQRILGASDSFYGIAWGLVDINNFCYVLVNPKKQFTTGRHIDDEWHPLISWTNAPIKHETGSVNEIAIFIQKGFLELHINGFQVFRHEWKNIINGNNIGLVVGRTMKVKISEITVSTETSVQIPQAKKLSPTTIKRTHVDSSNLKSIGYNNSSKILEIEFVNGAIYQYYAVPQRTYVELMQAKSHGKYFYAFIRDNFQYQQVQEKSIQQSSNYDEDYDDHDDYDYEEEGRAHLQDLYDIGLTDDDFGGRD